MAKTATKKIPDKIVSKKNGKTVLTSAANKTEGRVFGGYSGADIAVIDYVTLHRRTTLKDMAKDLFGGDYLKAKNAVRKPRWYGEIKMEGGGIYTATKPVPKKGGKK